MRNGWLFITGISILFSCSKIETEEELPVVADLQIQTMATQLPIVHIEADSMELIKMLVNYNARIVIPAHITIYGPTKTLLVEEDAHIEIKGVGSAAQDMKPIGIVLHQPFNNFELGILSPKVIAPGDDLGTIQNFRMRNSSQDYGITMMKDLAYTELALRAGFDLETKYGRPAHVFINSEYYGLHNLRTDVDAMGLSHLLHVDSSDITLLKMDNINHKLEFKEGDEVFAETFLQAIRDEDVETIHRYLDIDNFIDYIVYEDYIGNTDWPHNNSRAYSVNGSKFRFILFDLDMAAERTNNPLLPEMEFRDDYISRTYQTLLAFDPEFEARLHERQKHWYSQLSPELFNCIVDELTEDIEMEILYFISKRGVPENSFQWKLNLEQLKRKLERTDHTNRKKYGLN